MFEAIDAANAIIQPIYRQHKSSRQKRERRDRLPGWGSTIPTEIVVRKKGSPMIYPVVNVLLLAGIEMPLFMAA